MMVYGKYFIGLLLWLTFVTLEPCSAISQTSSNGLNPLAKPVLSEFGEGELGGFDKAVQGVVQPPNNAKPLSALKKVKKVNKESFLINPKVKLALTTFSTLCVVFELLETLLERVPLFHSFSKKFMKFQFGVLVLCLSEGMHLISELFEHLGEREEAKEETEKDEEIEKVLERTFSSEEEAARAYDATAIELYSHAAQLNFQYPNQEIDENGELPRRQSGYRGVRWNNILNAWQVDCRYLTPPQHHLQQHQHQSQRKRHHR